MGKGKANNGGKTKSNNKSDTKKSESKKSSSQLKGCQKIKVRHILCEKQGKILEAQAKLDAGVKFDEVAKEFSEDKARAGGLLGEMDRASLVKGFADVAFELPESTCANPVYSVLVHTTFGWHIAMVEKRI